MNHSMAKLAAFCDKNYSSVVDLPAGEVWYSALSEKIFNPIGSQAFYWFTVCFDTESKELKDFIADLPEEYRKYFKTYGAKGAYGHTRFTAREAFGNFTVYGEKTLMAVLSVRFPKDDFGRRCPQIHSVRYV